MDKYKQAKSLVDKLLYAEFTQFLIENCGLYHGSISPLFLGVVASFCSTVIN